MNWEKHKVNLPPVTRRWLNPATELAALVNEQTRLPDWAEELYSQPADLRVTILNFGERQPAAEDVYFHFSRPVAGRHQLFLTSGTAAFSASGAYLLIHNIFVLIVIEAQSLQAWHYVAPTRTLFLGVGWQDEQVVGKMLAYGQPTAAAQPWGPWSWAEITQRWGPGSDAGRSGRPPQRPSSHPSRCRPR